MYHYTLCGLDNVWLLNGYTLHETEFGEGVSFDDPEGLDREIARQLLEYCPRLSGKEFRFLRKHIGLSQRRLADFFGKDEQSVAIWEKKNKVPVWADRMMRGLVAQFHGKNPNLLDMNERICHMDAEYGIDKIELKESDGAWTAAGYR